MRLKLMPDNPIRQLSLMMLLSSLLLLSQLSVADHELEHPFHHHDSLCDSFLAFDYKPSTAAKAITLEPIYPPFVGYAFIAISATNSPAQTLSIRGPPASSTL